MKDPAALLYIDKWIVATTEMRADARAYYMDLILSQFDKGSLPNDIEELANICRVRFSEFDNFKQVFEQVLKQKFKVNSNGRLENDFAKEIIQKRENFIEKRSISGKLSYVIKFATKKLGATLKQIEVIKKHFDVTNIDTKNEHLLKHLLEQTLELYINENEDEDINKGKEGAGEKQFMNDFGLFGIRYLLEESETLAKEIENNYSQIESLVRTAFDEYKITITTDDVINMIPSFIQNLKDTSSFPITDKEAKKYFGHWFKSKIKTHVNSTHKNGNRSNNRVSDDYRRKLADDLQAGINQATAAQS